MKMHSENIDWAVFRSRHHGNQREAGSEHRVYRSQLVRAAVKDGWDTKRLMAAHALVDSGDNQLRLWQSLKPSFRATTRRHRPP